ncbi:hypothetical protein DFP91_3498 [Pseudorhodoplanes sinuspersici]|nr:hypothetical protein DFP91_3498 [Pseudorhodoplanes sinuspersici]
MRNMPGRGHVHDLSLDPHPTAFATLRQSTSPCRGGKERLPCLRVTTPL